MTGDHSIDLRANPFEEIRLVSLGAARGINYWSWRPVTRLDIAVGAFDTISSADIEGITDTLLNAMPGLSSHECSVGRQGGFVSRLRRGTYAPHIIEHVAIELQVMVGEDVGFGRTRGAGEPGTYTIVFEHASESVGRRAAIRALEAVQLAFAGRLGSISTVVTELTDLAAAAPAPAAGQRVWCGITGSAHRSETRRELIRRGCSPRDVVDVAPAQLLRSGVPYARSDIAIILDNAPADVPSYYRDSTRSCQLLSTIAEAVIRDGVVVCSARDREIQAAALDGRHRIAVFMDDRAPSREDWQHASTIAFVRQGRIWIDAGHGSVDAGFIRSGMPAAAQTAAALAWFIAVNLQPYR